MNLNREVNSLLLDSVIGLLGACKAESGLPKQHNCQTLRHVLLEADAQTPHVGLQHLSSSLRVMCSQKTHQTIHYLSVLCVLPIAPFWCGEIFTHSATAMDPVVAIGLVSGILSFVGAAGKILKLSWTLYNSVEGTSEETAMRLKLAENMAAITTRMAPTNLLARTDPEDKALVTLARECNNLANDIKKELRGLKPKRRKSKAHSGLVALKTLLAEPKIKDLEKHLQSCRDQLHFHIAALSR